MANTLIITLKITEEAQYFFDKKREYYYPRHCNYVPAHLTFFHAAPNNNLFIDNLKEAANHSEILMQTDSVLAFNNGMAYTTNNQYLQNLHAALQQKFINQLSGKDKKLWQPHITIQNKVTAFKAERSYKELKENFIKFNFKVEGFNGYVYAKQKWEPSFFIPFNKL